MKKILLFLIFSANSFAISNQEFNFNRNNLSFEFEKIPVNYSIEINEYQHDNIIQTTKSQIFNQDNKNYLNISKYSNLNSYKYQETILIDNIQENKIKNNKNILQICYKKNCTSIYIDRNIQSSVSIQSEDKENEYYTVNLFFRHNNIDFNLTKYSKEHQFNYSDKNIYLPFNNSDFSISYKD